ncbi:MAG: ATP-binding protein [Armatimonadota bacterium]|nr:ATP-binding protein [Armatimonadota bacterium]
MPTRRRQLRQTEGAAPRPDAPHSFEGLGVFYLGRPYDIDQGRPTDGFILYDAKDLVTHAVCVGMTGSGKTGLCLALLEEAALDGVPAIAIDPKGDLGNLLLAFPDLRPEDFLPWIDEDDARAANLAPLEFARQQAAMWAKGLAEWGQDGGRIRRLREAAEFVIYTPGSTAGVPVSVLSSLQAPPPAVREDREALADRVSGTVTGLLALVGVQSDPLQSREHILISTILDAAWRAGADLDLAGLIHQIQNPPVQRVGVLDLETFYPSAQRFELAIRLNNLLASPDFTVWTEGEPMDVGRFLYTPAGKPRVAIFSIAHLTDAERMFFVSLLLNQVLGWVRGQSGTTSLRAVLYMDEIFGFFPPVANPPSKPPLLALLKQARAFGLGVLLATQNPVDLDYKGLANAGTWFLGRLQTERDKVRVLEGLEGVAATAGGSFDRARMDTLLSGLGRRIFLLHNVHGDAPVVFQTRWAMSYLRGPLTQDQIKRLMDPLRPAFKAAEGPSAPTPAAAPAPASSVTAAAAEPAATIPPAPLAAGLGRPLLPPDIPQYFVPGEGSGLIRYEPMLLGAAQVRFHDPKLGVDLVREFVALAPLGRGVVAVDWAASQTASFGVHELHTEPTQPATFGDLPPPAARPKSYEVWGKEFARWLLQAQSLVLYRHPPSGETSQPGESERDFRIRLQTVVREKRDQVVERLRQKYGQKVASLTERLRRAQEAVEREKLQVQQQQIQTAVSLGATLLGALMGRRAATAGTLGRATTTARGASRSYKEAQDVRRAQETVAVLRQQLAELEAQITAETDNAIGAFDPASDPLETVVVRPKRAGVTVRALGLAWVPRAHG